MCISNVYSKYEKNIYHKGDKEMYFVNEEHERNYLKLLDARSVEPSDDPQYETSFYITAYPEIYKCFDWGTCKVEYSPLGELIYSQGDKKGINPDALTGTTLPLAKTGQSLFNGYNWSINYWRKCIFLYCRRHYTCFC
ncbi:DUF2538 family protein (plasmid) [Bacillus mycoides]|uniref:DUF2538 family protein n=1 Tax=Bacillus mycoides TaxID=1405 RepID=UPI001C02300A|nr:DUF2538 family protein [Bacillus mycoides]QWH04230.1 DUF2538 family protein [Bacillus mycoides]